MKIYKDQLSKAYQLLHGDCLEVMKGLPEGSVDAVVTDPPYGLSKHDTDEVLECLKCWVEGKPFVTKKSSGFMSKEWDSWVPGPEVFKECLRVLKPGGHMLVFAGTRSMDLMCMAVRLAGFELRDSIGFAHDGGGAPLMAWTYGSGFPKSLDISKAIDKDAGAERKVIGRKSDPRYNSPVSETSGSPLGNLDPRPNAVENYAKAAMITAPTTDAAKQWNGWGTALKPAWEPIILARKPLEGTVAQNVLKHGTGGMNIDGCRVEYSGDADKASATPQGKCTSKESESIASKPDAGRNLDRVEFERPELNGRFPANLIHDGSEVVTKEFPNVHGAGKSRTGGNSNQKGAGGLLGVGNHDGNGMRFGDSGSAARFFKSCPPTEDDHEAARIFYCAKAAKSEKTSGLDSPMTHPTVKPLTLMSYLCRLITPPGGTILDPFLGSGTTGCAAAKEGFRFIGIEKEPEYITIAMKRVVHAIATSKNIEIIEDDTEPF